MSAENDLLNQFRDLVGNVYEAVEGPEKKQHARTLMTFGPALIGALAEGGLFLCKEGEAVVGGKVVKIRVPVKGDTQ